MFACVQNANFPFGTMEISVYVRVIPHVQVDQAGNVSICFTLCPLYAVEI